MYVFEDKMTKYYSVSLIISFCIVRYLVWAPSDRSGKTVQRLCGDCDAGVVAVQSPQILHGNRTALVRAP